MPTSQPKNYIDWPNLNPLDLKEMGSLHHEKKGASMPLAHYIQAGLKWQKEDAEDVKLFLEKSIAAHMGDQTKEAS